jgi:hypothetical protein
MRTTRPSDLFRPEIESILVSAGFQRSNGRPAVAFVQLGRWLVRPQTLRLFLRRKTLFTLRRLVFPHIVLFSRNPLTEHTAAILVREEGRPKVTFFDFRQQIKTVVWVYEEDFNREILGIEHFAKHPSSVPAVLTINASQKAITQRLVGRFMGDYATLDQLVALLIDIHGTRHDGQTSVASYLLRWNDDCRTQVALAGDLHETAQPAIQFLTGVQNDLGASFVTSIAHGDISTFNALAGPHGIIWLIDFDLAAPRPASFDLVYLHVTDTRFKRQPLVNSLRRLERLAPPALQLDDTSLYLFHLSLFIVTMGFEVCTRYRSMPDADKRPRGRHVHMNTARAMLESALSASNETRDKIRLR